MGLINHLFILLSQFSIQICWPLFLFESGGIHPSLGRRLGLLRLNPSKTKSGQYIGLLVVKKYMYILLLKYLLSLTKVAKLLLMFTNSEIPSYNALTFTRKSNWEETLIAKLQQLIS